MGTANVIPSLSTFNQPVAGKTGTTEETRDLWFCGYTPQVAVAIWNGYPNEEKTIYHFGTYAHPSDVSCPIFAYFCNKLLAHTQREEFPKASQPEYRNNAEWEFPNTYTTGTTGRSTNTGNNSNNNANNNSYNNNYNNNSNNEYGND
jgi:penicillin-binding protein 1A